MPSKAIVPARSMRHLRANRPDPRTRAAHAGVAAIVVLIGGWTVSPVDHRDALEACLTEPRRYLRRILTVRIARRQSIARGMQRALERERLHGAVPSLTQAVVA